MFSQFTSESVSPGHPDKVADQISDRILDAYLKKDPNSRVACEVMLSSKAVILGGELGSLPQDIGLDIPHIVKQCLLDIGYDDPKKGIDANTCMVEEFFNLQSPDIARGIQSGQSLGAGDQGMVFGYALDETKDLMPLSLVLSHQLMKNLAKLRRRTDELWPDGKSLITVNYNNEGALKQQVSRVCVSCQHSPAFSSNSGQKRLQELLVEELIKKTVPASLLTKDYQFAVNPAGRFEVGGPKGDCGLTGRKTEVDSYGGHGAHGGGAFSGKDPSKVDRSGAYVARHIAKHIVALGLAKRCLIQMAYIIGESKPVSLVLEDYGTLKVPYDKLMKVINKLWDLRLSQVIKDLGLLNPIYASTSVYGHFGGNSFPWEKLNRLEELSSEFPNSCKPLECSF